MKLFSADWSRVFAPDTPLLELVARGTVLYLALLILMRLMLRRSSGDLAMMDLIFLLLLAHSERTPQEMRARSSQLFGIQSWVAFPARYEETEPAFAHHDSAELPVVEGEGKRVRLICGSLYGARSPVQTFSELFYADVTIGEGARLQVPVEYEERAAYIVEGSIGIIPEGRTFHAGQLLIFKPGEEITLKAQESDQARLMLLGGEPLDGKRHIWWNFVSSSRERIEQAKEDWKAGRFAPVPEEKGFIPLPNSGPAIVRYP